ncbi:Tfp pilus assembly protein PilF [Desulfuromusa kysingii]|uniref:Tfp pilus assembly protein PilF n=1 Tax=Desulfuromusa kysingii TaxID=37625 RepID=A0A1H4DFS4_9BACT|nr:tetratricopeptide repeat protein [Desulfuromusa kysingii]SEA71447.1 Tfp pilus assembly protein PilF [Desulfuromusa kysingii]
MLAGVKDAQHLWNEDELKQAIIDLKSNQCQQDLKRFLSDRIEDPDPCCCSKRAKLWNELGLAMLSEENIEQADLCFTEALKIDPMDISAVYNLANVSLQQGSFERANGLYERVLLAEPDFFGAVFNLALSYLYSDQYEKAQPLFVRAATLQPDNHSAHYWAAETLLRSRSFAASLTYFKQAYALNPNHFETVNGYAMALHQAGHNAEAISICDSSLMNLGPSVVSLRTKADALIELDRIDEAALCHLDIAHIDLDSRDTIVSRLQALYRQSPQKFTCYRNFMLDRAPSFEPLLSVIKEFEAQQTAEVNHCH